MALAVDMGTATLLDHPCGTKAIRNQVARLHGALGHPSNERLTRMLTINGATKEVVQASKDLRCEICARIHPPAAVPKSGSTNPERFNQHVDLAPSADFLSLIHI